jgi:hypothetical protein
MENHPMKHAEELPYWMTSQTSPDTWIDRTIKILTELGGKLQMEAFGKDGYGRGAYMLSFSVKDESYRIVWPLTQSRSGKISAEKIQAATSLYHYVKAISLAAAVIGTKAALFTFMQLPDGSTVVENTDNAILQAGNLFRLPASTDQGEIFDGEMRIVP